MSDERGNGMEECKARMWDLTMFHMLGEAGWKGKNAQEIELKQWGTYQNQPSLVERLEIKCSSYCFLCGTFFTFGHLDTRPQRPPFSSSSFGCHNVPPQK